MIDAAGAIYVIGGSVGTYPNFIYQKDVWVSTDGGPKRTGRGYSRGTQGVLEGQFSRSKGILRVLKG